jgi:hypothetical protein
MRIACLLLLAVACVHGALPTWPKFFLMMFENHGYDEVTTNSNWMPWVAGSFLLTDYHAVTHPSQPNYVSQLGGNYFTCTDDSNCNLNKPNLVDLLDPKRIPWKAYEENYTPGTNGACNMDTEDYPYYRKHNPFMSFVDITSNITRCQNIVNNSTLQKDIMNNALPAFSYYTPNINDDGHDSGLSFAGQYFASWMNAWYLPNTGPGKAFENVLFMVTWDEDEGSEDNHVVAFFRGPNVTAGLTGVDSYTHYSITKFVEQNWGLGNLGQNDVTANNFAQEIK